MSIKIKNNSRKIIFPENSFMFDPNLSAKAKGVMMYLLSIDGQNTSMDEILSNFKDGKTAIHSALKELKESGYIEVEEKRDSKGRFSHSIYHLKISKEER